MIFSAIQADVATFLGMTIGTSSRFTTTEQNAAINAAYREAQSKMASANINYYMGEVMTMDTVADTGRYQLPSGFLAMKRLEVQFDDDEDKVKAIPLDINDIQATVNPDSDPWSQQAPFYCAWEDDLYIKPIPDESSAGWDTDNGSAMKLWFIELQDDLSAAADVPALPSTYHHILAYPAIAKGFRKLRKFTEAKVYDDPVSEKGLWQAGLKAMVAENTHKDKVKPMGFTITRGTTRRSGIFRP